MKWLKTLKPVNGEGSRSWGYQCKAVSNRGRECIHAVDHGKMHKDEAGRFWTEMAKP